MDPITLGLIGIGKYIVTHLGVQGVSTAAMAAVGTATVGLGAIAVVTISYLTYRVIVNSLKKRAANKARHNYKAFGALIAGSIDYGNARTVNARIWEYHGGSKSYMTGFANTTTGHIEDVEIYDCVSLDSELKNIHQYDPIVVYN